MPRAWPDYTPEEDILILACEACGDVPRLAKQLGRSHQAIRSRRYKLHREAGGLPPIKHQRQVNNPARPRGPIPFARPAFFEENLTLMTMGGVPPRNGGAGHLKPSRTLRSSPAGREALGSVVD